MANVTKRLISLNVVIIFTILLSYPAFSQRNNLTTVKKGSTAPAAKVDSTASVKVDSMQVSYFTQSFDSIFLGKIHLIDTSLFNASYFDPLHKADQIYATLSNTGLAHKSLFFNPNNNIGFDMTNKANEAYLKTSKDIRFFNPLMPYSQINYTMGSKKEQQLGVSFAREFFPRVILGMDYRLINSPGPYLNNKTNNVSVSFSGSYRTKSNRYGIAAYYFRNKL